MSTRSFFDCRAYKKTFEKRVFGNFQFIVLCFKKLCTITAPCARERNNIHRERENKIQLNMNQQVEHIFNSFNLIKKIIISTVILKSKFKQQFHQTSVYPRVSRMIRQFQSYQFPPKVRPFNFSKNE